MLHAFVKKSTKTPPYLHWVNPALLTNLIDRPLPSQRPQPYLGLALRQVRFPPLHFFHRVTF